MSASPQPWGGSVGAPASFEERQRFQDGGASRSILIVSGVAGLAGLAAAWATDTWHAPVALGSLAVGGGVAALLLTAELHVTVQSDALCVRFFPFKRERRIAWSEIASAEARTYRPILEYGGWGVRFGLRGGAYNVYGNRGVQLVFSDGRRLLIGSQRADQLALAIGSARGGRAGGR